MSISCKLIIFVIECITLYPIPVTYIIFAIEYIA